MTLSRNKTFRLFIIFLLITVCLVQTAPLAQARASDYIFSYSAYVNADGGGNVSVWFNISGTGKMDEIGSTMIVLYEQNGTSWKSVKTYKYLDYSDMLGYNKSFHGSSVSYPGTAGKSYYAVVYFWAGKGGNGDDRAFTTGVVVAK